MTRPSRRNAGSTSDDHTQNQSGADLDRWLDEVVGSAVRARGFVGTRRRYKRANGDIVCLIAVQGSTGNVLGRLKFTINYGVVHLGIASTIRNERPRLRVEDCDIRRRTSNARGDLWWNVGVGAQTTAVAASVIQTLDRDVLPFLDQYGSVEGFANYWTSQPALGAKYLEALSRDQHRVPKVE